MAMNHVGVALHERSAAAAVAGVRAAERLGVPAAWLTTGIGSDALTIFAAASTVTTRIRMGTAIVPTYPRHPVVVAQQAADIDNLAPGRFVLGVGPSHKPQMEGRYGLPYVRPLEHVREFVTVVKGLLAGNEVKFAGARYRADAKLNHGANVPVIISALRAGSFELAGEIADGAVTWLCPARYLREVALPAMIRGAAKRGAARPRLVAHAFLALTSDRAELARAVSEAVAFYPKLTNYQEMFVAAGFPEARSGDWSAGMIDAAILHGDAPSCRAKVRDFLALAGADELILSVMATGADRAASVERTLAFVGEL